MVTSRERRPPATESDSFTERFEIRKDIRELRDEGIEKVTNKKLYILISRTISALRNPEEQPNPTNSVQITHTVNGWEKDLDVVLDNPTKDKRMIFSKDAMGNVRILVVEGIHTDKERKEVGSGLMFNDKKQILLDLFTALSANQSASAALQNFQPVSRVLPFSAPSSPSQPRLIPSEVVK